MSEPWGSLNKSHFSFPQRILSQIEDSLWPYLEILKNQFSSSFFFLLVETWPYITLKLLRISTPE